MAIHERLASGELQLDFNWNTGLHPLTEVTPQFVTEPSPEQILGIKIVSEDLRDGLQGVPEYPSLKDMVDYTDLLTKLGVDRITVGIYPGDDNELNTRTKQLLHHLQSNHPLVTPIILSLATQPSLNWVLECKEINSNLAAIVFMGTSPSRLLVEEWDQESILNRLYTAIEFATSSGVEVIGATEHTTQTPPDFLRNIVRTEVAAGASSFCIADTIGTARPSGAYRITSFIQEVLQQEGRSDVNIEWHGHRDTANDLANAMAASSAGARRIHTVARGIGERAGNTRLESVLVNLNQILRENGIPSPWNMSNLVETLEAYDRMTNLTEPHHGILSSRSHTTSAGIHTAAMLKARKLASELTSQNRPDLSLHLTNMANTIYSAIDPTEVGKTHSVRVSPWSGTSTVKLAWENISGSKDLSPQQIDEILREAKSRGRELSDVELSELISNKSNS